MRNVLVTGGAGFIGSNFIRYLLKEHREIDVLVNLDFLTYAGNLENLTGCEKDPRYHFIRGDIRNRTLLDQIFQKYRPDTVVHFAAESHVDRSITDPETFLLTNVLGTMALLNAAKDSWKTSPEDKYSREYRPGVRFLQVSTDEVYGSLGRTGRFSEVSPVSPNSPYSASKASADMLVRACYQTYGLPINITRCSNNYGPYQFPEKLIPLIILNARADKRLPVYGDGMQVRDWLHVKDHCAAIAAVLERGTVGEIYNIGGNNERTNIEVVRFILKELGKPESLISYVQDRPGHDRRYAIDSTKLSIELNWRPEYTFETGMRETIRWYLEHQSWSDRITAGEYQNYYTRMYGMPSD